MAEKLKLPELTKEQTQLLVAALFCAGALGFVYWKYFWAPVSARITAAGAKLESVEKDITAAEAQEKRLDKLKIEVSSLKQQKEAAERRLPKGKNVPDLIYTLTDMGRKYNVEIHSISPMGRTARQYFAEVSYGITLTGSYHSLGKFLTALGTSERIFSAQNLSITAAPGAGGDTISATFTLIAYQYNG